MIAKTKGVKSDPGVVGVAIESYLRTIEDHASLLEHEDLAYDRRIRIKLDKNDVVALRRDGKLSDSVRIQGVNSSLTILGLPAAQGSVLWGELITILNKRGANFPWPESAVRWAEALGTFLSKVLNNRIDPDKQAEALPLYLNYIPIKQTADSYRPSVSRKILQAGEIEFEVAFAQLPPEYVTHPGAAASQLFQYISFCRMVRFGILESDRFQMLFQGKESDELLEAKVQEFSVALMNIRIEFLNRGLNKAQLFDSLPEHMHERAKKLQARWYATVGPLEPVRRPTAKMIKDAYPILLDVNKRYFSLVNSAMKGEISKMRTK